MTTKPSPWPHKNINRIAAVTNTNTNNLDNNTIPAAPKTIATTNNFIAAASTNNIDNKTIPAAAKDIGTINNIVAIAANTNDLNKPMEPSVHANTQKI